MTSVSGSAYAGWTGSMISVGCVLGRRSRAGSTGGRFFSSSGTLASPLTLAMRSATVTPSV
jgi:hypothetical protein